MKKYAKAAVFLVTALSAAGAAGASEVDSNPTISSHPIVGVRTSYQIEVIQDSETGCQYFLYDSRSGMDRIIPRIDSDGRTHKGCHDAEK
jgi:hypothetical protein